MKIILNDNTEYQVSIVCNTEENQLCIGFTNIVSYDVLKSSLTAEALSVVKFFAVDDDKMNYDVYENYSIYTGKSTITTNADETLNVIMYFNRTDETTLKINKLQNDIDTIKKNLKV